jgi:hypothetical protein
MAEEIISAADFTPGPWNVSGGTIGLWVAGPDRNANVLCDILYRSRKGANAEDRANARLIAAAPTLYERLKDVLERCAELEVFMCDNFDHDDDCNCEGDKARAALALVNAPQSEAADSVDTQESVA